MIRICLFVFGFSLCAGLPSWAQEQEEIPAIAPIDESANEVQMAALEDAQIEQKPPLSDEAGPRPSSGVGYYSAPNSEGQQSFLIEDRTTIHLARSKETDPIPVSDRRETGDR